MGFGKGKTHELDVDNKLLWPVNKGMNRLEAEMVRGSSVGEGECGEVCWH